MPLATEETLLTLEDGLAHFKAVYMPTRNYSHRTREEYEGDLTGVDFGRRLRNLAVVTPCHSRPR